MSRTVSVTPLTWRRVAWLLLAAFLGAAGGCSPQSPVGPSLPDGELRVLFVGNSLTYTNNAPAMVDALAESDGVDFEYVVVAYPNFGLGDHWSRRIADVIRDLAPDVVVLQQGPSSLESSRAYLLEWAGQIGEVVTEVGGRSALFMVWPDDTRIEFFDAVRDNYAAAAELVDGIFIPAGETWRAAWELDPELAFYGPDGFHPSALGSAAAALTIHAMLTGSPDQTPPCPAEVLVDAETAELLCAAMREAVAEYGVW